ncbi:MAG: hypothetical protein ABIO02_04220 [Patescibacteria group bacterium]
MFPIIFISDDLKKQEEFVQSVIDEGKYLPFYIYKIEPLKTELSIDQIRAIKKEIISAIPNKRLFVLSAFDTASLEAQNAFLKTLEEKNSNNQFVLLVNDIGRILPTILSRSKSISTKKDTTKLNESVQTLLNNIEQKKDFSFLQTVSTINREDALKLFDHIILYLEDQLKKQKRATTVLVKKALQQKSLLLNNNLNPQLAVDAFLLFYKKTVSRTP